MKAAQNYLSEEFGKASQKCETQVCQLCFPADAGGEEEVPEDAFQPADAEAAEENWSDQEIPPAKRDEMRRTTTKDLREAVRKAHYGLGHPSREVFVRMLRLGLILRHVENKYATSAKLMLPVYFDGSADL